MALLAQLLERLEVGHRVDRQTTNKSLHRLKQKRQINKDQRKSFLLYNSKFNT